MRVCGMSNVVCGSEAACLLLLRFLDVKVHWKWNGCDHLIADWSEDRKPAGSSVQTASPQCPGSPPHRHHQLPDKGVLLDFLCSLPSVTHLIPFVLPFFWLILDPILCFPLTPLLLVSALSSLSAQLLCFLSHPCRSLSWLTTASLSLASSL